jgi:hypothetical protein
MATRAEHLRHGEVAQHRAMRPLRDPVEDLSLVSGGKTGMSAGTIMWRSFRTQAVNRSGITEATEKPPRRMFARGGVRASASTAATTFAPIVRLTARYGSQFPLCGLT